MSVTGIERLEVVTPSYIVKICLTSDDLAVYLRPAWRMTAGQVVVMLAAQARIEWCPGTMMEPFCGRPCAIIDGYADERAYLEPKCVVANVMFSILLICCS